MGAPYIYDISRLRVKHKVDKRAIQSDQTVDSHRFLRNPQNGNAHVIKPCTLKMEAGTFYEILLHIYQTKRCDKTAFPS